MFHKTAWSCSTAANIDSLIVHSPNRVHIATLLHHTTNWPLKHGTVGKPGSVPKELGQPGEDS
jgi:hypothetical protein